MLDRLGSPRAEGALFDMADSACVVVGTELGRGAVGRVLSVEWLGLPLAVKELLPLANIADPSTRWHAVRDFENEQAVNIALSYHPNIVAYLGSCTKEALAGSVNDDGPGFGLVFERLQGCELNVREYGIGRRTLSTVAVALCIARGLAHAHSRGIMHRDVKPSNVLLASSTDAKVCDWGLAVRIESTAKSADTGTNEYMAPEVFRGLDYDGKADVFSFGILLYALAAKSPYPYDSSFLTPAQVVDAVAHRGLRPQLFSSLTADEPELCELMEKCWSHEADERPSMGEVCRVLCDLLAQKRSVVSSDSSNDKSSTWGSWFGF